jgi:CDP-glucose 4,6-dehydratase
MSPFLAAYRGKRVWISGHTGFKGSWLTSWLLRLGAEVWGFSLPPTTTPALFDQLSLAKRMEHHELGDVRDEAAVLRSLTRAEPDFVFHLAAQPLVRASYRAPVETFATNVTGTLHVLEALRKLQRVCSAVFITTDKVYENREWVHGYRETDPLGGHDPYSASKAAAEVAIACYRNSFFTRSGEPGGGALSRVGIASARAGNVIGGGDWAEDRIVPDCIRALAAGVPIRVRNPASTRPWQHVLEPLGGYLRLGHLQYEALQRESSDLASYSSAFNFGPEVQANQSVRRLVEQVMTVWPGQKELSPQSGAVHEASRLHLSTDKAFHLLDWKSTWDFEKTIATTIQWYREALQSPGSEVQLTERDIADFETSLTNQE